MSEPALDVLGFDGPQEQVYRLLLDRPDASVAEIAASGALAPRRIQEAVRSLEHRGLVARVAGGRARFAATDPAVALELLLVRERERLERARAAVAGLHETYRRSRSDPTELVEVVRGRRAVAERVLHLLHSATEEVLRFNKPPFVGSQDEQVAVEIRRLARGVRFRDLYDAAALEVPGMPGLVDAANRAGAESRVLADLPLKLLLVDGRAALTPLSLGDAGAQDSALLVRSSSLVDALAALFESAWARAASYQPGDVSAYGDLPAECRRPLELMAAGLKDRAISRQLGVAPSTVDRRIRRIMRALDAQTRFQAGVLACRRGWLAAPSEPAGGARAPARRARRRDVAGG